MHLHSIASNSIELSPCTGSWLLLRREHDWGLPEDGFDKETAAMVMRLLTVRAVQQVVVQLMEFNQLQASDYGCK